MFTLPLPLADMATAYPHGFTLVTEDGRTTITPLPAPATSPPHEPVAVMPVPDSLRRLMAEFPSGDYIDTMFTTLDGIQWKFREGVWYPIHPSSHEPPASKRIDETKPKPEPLIPPSVVEFVYSLPEESRRRFAFMTYDDVYNGVWWSMVSGRWTRWRDIGIGNHCPAPSPGDAK